MLTDPESSRAAYEEWHQRLPVDTETDTPWHLMIKARLRPDRDLRAKRVLEIGCGRGGFACWLARQTDDPPAVVAADFSSAAVQKGHDFAAGAGIRNVQWEVGDIQAIAHESGSFDTVFSCETIEHVPDPARAVRELGRVLKPGGRLFLTTPNYLGVYGLYRGYLRLTGRRYTEEGQPINQLMLLPRTRRMVSSAGLRIEVAETSGHYLLVPGRVPRRLPSLDRVSLLRPFGLHSLVVAERPR